jgi:glycosyltransferase involved in cell wall biosynthesis
MSGLFVQKHAEAVGLYCNVKVLYVYADDNIDTFELVEKFHSGISELIVYYPTKKNKIIHKTTKAINYIIAYWKGYKQIIKEGFVPDIIHVNILTRTGFMALLLNKWKGIPYVITEHWSRYLAIRNSYNGIIRRFITKLLVKNAKAVLPVSEILKNSMLAHNLQNPNYSVVNNVVDNFFFNEIPVVHRLKKRIIHVSCFDEKAKNVCGILRAVSELSKQRQDFEFLIIGTGIDFKKVHSYAETLNLRPGILRFLGEKTPKEVANWIQNSDFMVMFSNYETAGVVIAESLVSGKPVLSTKVGAAPEYINERNGILIPAGDEKALIVQMHYILDHLSEFNNEEIKKEAQNKFSYKSIGNIIAEIYKQVLSCK